MPGGPEFVEALRRVVGPRRRRLPPRAGAPGAGTGGPVERHRPDSLIDATGTERPDAGHGGAIAASTAHPSSTATRSSSPRVGRRARRGASSSPTTRSPRRPAPAATASPSPAATTGSPACRSRTSAACRWSAAPSSRAPRLTVHPGFDPPPWRRRQQPANEAPIGVGRSHGVAGPHGARGASTRRSSARSSSVATPPRPTGAPERGDHLRHDRDRARASCTTASRSTASRSASTSTARSTCGGRCCCGRTATAPIARRRRLACATGDQGSVARRRPSHGARSPGRPDHHRRRERVARAGGARCCSPTTGSPMPRSPVHPTRTGDTW